MRHSVQSSRCQLALRCVTLLIYHLETTLLQEAKWVTQNKIWAPNLRKRYIQWDSALEKSSNFTGKYKRSSSQFMLKNLGNQ